MQQIMTMVAMIMSEAMGTTMAMINTDWLLLLLYGAPLRTKLDEATCIPPTVLLVAIAF